MKGTPSFKMLPTVGSAESCIVRLPGTSTSCASALRSETKQKSTAENGSVLLLIFGKVMLDSPPQELGERPNSEQRHSGGIPRTAPPSTKRHGLLDLVLGRRVAAGMADNVIPYIPKKEGCRKGRGV